MKGDNEQEVVKRQQHEDSKEGFNGKWRRREWIKKNLQDIPRQSNEECENDHEELNQSKKCKRGINSLLKGCSHDVGKLPEERENQPISEPALQDEPVQQIPATSAAPPQPAKQAERGGWCESAVDSDGKDRQSGIDRYSTGQHGDRAEKSIAKSSQGGEKRSHSTRNHQRRSSWRKNTMKTMIFFFLMLATAFGSEIGKEWKETDMRMEVFDCAIPMSL